MKISPKKSSLSNARSKKAFQSGFKECLNAVWRDCKHCGEDNSLDYNYNTAAMLKVAEASAQITSYYYDWSYLCKGRSTMVVA
jgi:hypothetical protein